MFDLSALVRYITRFTEESFASLIAIIFIYEAFKKQIAIIDDYGINPHPENAISTDCMCFPPESEAEMNITLAEMNNTMVTGIAATTMSTVANMTSPLFSVSVDPDYGVWDNTTNMTMAWVNMTKEQCTTFGGLLKGDGCAESKYYPDVFFLSVLLFMGTYMIAMNLKEFKTSAYFPTFVSTPLRDLSR